MLRIEPENQLLHAYTRSRAKMFEFAVPEEQHVKFEGIDLSGMLDLTIGLLGDLASREGLLTNEQEKYFLLFSAQYFSSLLEGRVILNNQDLFTLLTSATYYLSSYPGSSKVILDALSPECELDLIEEVLRAVLAREHFSAQFEYQGNFLILRDQWNLFVSEYDANTEPLLEILNTIRSNIYAIGSDKDLLLIDVIRSVVRKRVSSSAFKILSERSGVPVNGWDSYFQRNNIISEFWPSQMKLAENGIYEGASGVIQMPTSAGKTRSTEFIIRSSFLSARSTLAVIVAPFRSLCQEIYNDFAGHFEFDNDVHLELVSDVLQEDADPFNEGEKSILILTPEKLDYLIRQEPSIAARIGLIIYDEGHMFDDSSRGTKYELLLASLKQKLEPDTQIILISAVISNAQQVKDWLIGQDGVLVDGTDLSPTSRNIAFTEWSARYKSLQFVNPENINQSLFFVPTLLKSYPLERKPREKADRFFPNANNIPQISAYLGCRLAAVGLTAVFTSRKDSAQKMMSDISDAFDRNIQIAPPTDFSDNSIEADKVIEYISETLGPDSKNVQAARLGVLCHHASIPHGLRLVTEYSLCKSYFKTVICTSTLAQGVNLPIRYLVVASSRQAQEKIKTRDFHNLMGRAGRSGKYTEGTVIFADPDIYRNRNRRGGKWSDVSGLLNSDNSEPSVSRLHLLLSHRPDDEEQVVIWERYTSIIRDNIYSYLMESLVGVSEVRESDEIVTNLVRSTLGYDQLQDDADKARLTEIFIEIGRDIIERVPSEEKRTLFAKSILNISQSEILFNYLRSIVPQLLDIKSEEDLLNVLWSMLYDYSDHKILKCFSETDSMELCNLWIAGTTFPEIYSRTSEMTHEPIRSFSVGSIVDLCQDSFSYDISTLLGTVSDFINSLNTENELDSVLTKIALLQKRMKYGVRNYTEVVVYELGFVDRSLARNISNLIINDGEIIFKGAAKRSIAGNEEVRTLITNNYPEYFLRRLEQI